VIITDFNIRKHTEEKKELEKYLLLDLSYKNLPQLLTLPDSLASKDDYKARDYYYSLRGVYFHDFRSGLDKKLYDFLNEYYGLEWPSFCYEKNRVYQEVFKMKDQVSSLEFQNAYLNTLMPLKMFDNLRSLNISNGNFNDLNELKLFPRLEKLQMKNAQLDTIAEFPHLVNLRELDLSDNDIKDIRPLRSLTNMEVLNLSGRNPIESFAPLLNMKKLKHLTIGEITPAGLEKLQHLFPDTKIEANVINVITSAE
jgi:Leucine-rich repeat (LRR) protein